MSLMLASVADLSEAKVAMSCGVDWIDIKNPREGALGAASRQTIAEIASWCAKRLPVSATIGDCWDDAAVIPGRSAAIANTGVDYIKAGMNACHIRPQALNELRRAVSHGVPIIVVCRAETPPGRRDVAALAQCGIAGIMLDTADKSAASLVDLLERDVLAAFISASREHRLLTGLAGRLRLKDVEHLVPLEADYLGFRSALCDHAERASRLSAARTREVREAIARASDKTTNKSSEVA